MDVCVVGEALALEFKVLFGQATQQGPAKQPSNIGCARQQCLDLQEDVPELIFAIILHQIALHKDDENALP